MRGQYDWPDYTTRAGLCYSQFQVGQDIVKLFRFGRTVPRFSVISIRQPGRGRPAPHLEPLYGLDADEVPFASGVAATTKSLPRERRDMDDTSFTLLELHLGDGDIAIGPFELFGAGDDATPIAVSEAAPSDDSDADATDDGAVDDSGCGASKKSIAGLLLALVALAAIAAGVAALRDGDEAPPAVAGDD